MKNKIIAAMLLTTMSLWLTACGTSEVEESRLVIPEPTQEEIITSGYGDNYVEYSITIETGEIFYFNLKTSETTLGAALNEKGMASITEDGIIETALHNEPGEGQSWNFYVDGYISEVSIMDTMIEDGKEFAIVVE